MATIPINDVDPRNEYVATAGQTVFPYTFWIKSEGDLRVFQEGTLLTLTTHYTVDVTRVAAGGNVTLVTGATLNDSIVIDRDIPIERVSEFQTAGDFKATVLNLELSSMIAQQQQLESKLGRVLALPPESVVSTTNFALPAVLTDQRGIKWDSASGAYIETTADPDAQASAAAASAAAALVSETNAAASETAAGVSETNAAASETAAAASAASINLPTISGGDATKILEVNATEDGYDLVAAPTSTDVAVEVSADDTTPGGLESKIAAGTGISLTTLNDGGNEQLEISAADQSSNLAVSNWTGRTASQANVWTGIAWANSLEIFAAVSSGGTNRVMTSPDGINWTNRTAATASKWQTVAWSEDLSLFVAGGFTGAIMTSPDGITWTARAAASAVNWSSVTWSPSLSLFAACAATSGTTSIMTSPDGINWTSRTTPTGTAYVGIIWSEELGYFVTVPNGGVIHFLVSSDGITWTTRYPPESNSFSFVTWAAELGVFAAVSLNGTFRVQTSLYLP